MRAAGNKRLDPQQQEGRLNRRVAVAGIAVNAIVAIVVALIAAFVTAHSTTIITSLGGQPAKTVTVTASPPAPTPNPRTSSSQPSTIQLPGGQAFTKGAFTISGGGIDLDRNPPESGNLPNTAPEIYAEYPTGLYFYNAQETAQWQQPGVPTQAECHHSELSNGQANLNFDLTSFQQSGQQARFCILTSEDRDAYVVIPGSRVVSNSPFPAVGIVWAMKLPLS